MKTTQKNAMMKKMLCWSLFLDYYFFFGLVQFGFGLTRLDDGLVPSHLISFILSIIYLASSLLYIHDSYVVWCDGLNTFMLLSPIWSDLADLIEWIDLKFFLPHHRSTTSSFFFLFLMQLFRFVVIVVGLLLDDAIVLTFGLDLHITFTIVI